ncbi:hypothetical protein BGZ54_000687 [Gamsiella multidivaricata]|nr:hypothetical protein BGZ54_000687 [Gamsiella multidivaricata]
MAAAIPVKNSIASYLANEILSLIFRHLMDRKSIVNCSLVSAHWHGPARVELARITQDMPFNGQGLVHAIRTRFETDMFPFMSMSLFDKLICNLSELYYYSNPETKEVFAPAYAPDMLYHLFWTFLFIDQEFRNPRSRPKVSCSYFVRLLQSEGGGYPQEYFDKKVLKNIYNDIRSRPLLPAPHLIRAVQETDSSHTNQPAPAAGWRGSSSKPTLDQRQSPFLKLDESLRRVRRWWKKARDEGEPSLGLSGAATVQDGNAGQGYNSLPTSQPIPLDSKDSANPRTSGISPQHHTLAPRDTSTLQPVPLLSTPSSSTPTPQNTSCQITHLSSVIFLQGTASQNRASLRSQLGTESELSIHKDQHVPSPIMNRGFTTVMHGWHPEGDGLDNVIRFPKPTRSSTLGSQHHILQCSELMREMDLDS